MAPSGGSKTAPSRGIKFDEGKLKYSEQQCGLYVDALLKATAPEALAGLTAAFGLGAVIGPTLAATFVEWVGVAAVMVMISVIVSAGAVGIWLRLPEKTPPKTQTRPINPLSQFAFGADPRILPFMIYGAIIWITQSLSLSTLAFFLMDRLMLDEAQGLQLSSIALAVGAGALSVAQLVVIPALKASPRTLMTQGAVITVLGSLFMLAAPVVMVITAQ